MTKKTKWRCLPNAAHIDRVLASVKAHPEAWVEASGQARLAARCAARNAVQDAARDVAWNAAWYAAQSATRGRIRDVDGGVAWGAISALIAWDDSVQYLDMPSDKLKVWAILSENPAAILLLPAVTAFEKIKELELA